MSGFKGTKLGERVLTKDGKRGTLVGYGGVVGVSNVRIEDGDIEIYRNIDLKSLEKIEAAAPELLETLIQIRRHGIIEKDGYETTVGLMNEAINKAIGTTTATENTRIMKTNLEIKIDTPKDAKRFLANLHRNGESFHPEDDAHEIVWKTCSPSFDEREKLNDLMDKVHNFNFCPCGYLLGLIKLQQ